MITFNEFAKKVEYLGYEINLIHEWATDGGSHHWFAEMKTKGNYFTPALMEYFIKYNIGIEPHEKYIIIDC